MRYIRKSACKGQLLPDVSLRISSYSIQFVENMMANYM